MSNEMESIRYEKQAWSEDQASIWSRLIFYWSFPVTRAAAKRSLELEDFPNLNIERSCPSIQKSLKQTFALMRSRRLRWPLLRAIRSTSRYTLNNALFLSIISLLIDYANIVSFYFFWRYLRECIAKRSEGDQPPTFAQGLIWIGAICVVQLLVAFCRIHAQYSTSMVDAQVKTALIALISEKSFSIDRFAKRHDAFAQTADASSTMTLMTVHAPRLGQLFTNCILGIRYLVNIPCTAIVLGYFIGWPAAVAIVLFIGFTLVAICVSFRAMRSRKAANTLTDRRIRHLQDMLIGIRLVKFFAWEDFFLRTSLNLRKQETEANRRATLWTTVHSTISSSSFNYAAIAAFALYARDHVLSGNPGMIFAGIAFLCLDRNSWELSRSVVAVLNAGPSVDLIERYLIADDEHNIDPGHVLSDELAMQLIGASYTWHSSSKYTARKFSIPTFTLELRSAQLLAVIGSTRSGKSSLLSGIVGDMPMQQGLVRLDGRPAYCPQVAWLQSATVRDNITLGQKFQQDIYDKVLEACALRTDIESLPKGDATELGENGVRFSGGQRARVSLARCIYQSIMDRRSVVLLDDPLSAVDANTSSLIFDKAILGLLRTKAVMLVTHQLHILSRCNRVILMQDGRIKADGKYETLMQQSSIFADFVGARGQSAIWQIAPRNSDPIRTNSTTGSPGLYDTDPALVIEEEDRARQKPSRQVYGAFVSDLTGKVQFISYTSLLIMSQVAVALISLQSAWWSEDRFKIGYAGNVALYAAFCFAHQAGWAPYNYLSQTFILRTSIKASEEALQGVLQAPMSFFDANPLGRLVNRFTADISELDTVLPISYWHFTLPIFFAAATLGTVIYYIPIFAALLVPWLILGGFVFKVYKAAPLETKRLSSQLSSKYLALAHEALVGRTTIKLAGYQVEFLDSLYTKIDEYNTVDFLSFAIFSGTSLAHNVTYIVMMFCGGLMLLRQRFDLTPSTAVVVYALLIVTASIEQTMLDTGSACQKSVNSLERLNHFAHDLPREGAKTTEMYDQPEVRGWPRKPSITFYNVNLRYKEELPLVLRNLTLEIGEREKVGVVGRTGAGKSSLIAAILRLVDVAGGSICIDGLDTRQVSLRALRNSIATIPQDPILFVGDVRKNLDPTGQIDDARLLDSLKQVGLSDSVLLDTEVEPQGSNFAAGEKQLLSLARALARHNKIILIDEATSNVDPAKDDEIQSTIQRVFSDCTILTIAHRIRTVIAYDRVVVMDAGRVAEIGRPKDLFIGGGAFRALCDQACIMEEDFPDDTVMPHGRGEYQRRIATARSM